uniref:Uncharacterized protein n=1 Tax=Anopheles quadriannulatus TaxID=34691 RepID=A0A182XF09_ANOQN
MSSGPTASFSLLRSFSRGRLDRRPTRSGPRCCRAEGCARSRCTFWFVLAAFFQLDMVADGLIHGAKDTAEVRIFR